MIRIEKTGRLAVHITFDAAGAGALGAAFGSDGRAVPVTADARLWGGRSARRDGQREATLEVVADEDRDVLLAEGDRLTLRLDRESIEAVAARLGEAVPDGLFPAEIAEVTLGEHGGERVTIYGELVSESITS